jgi:hypothetical protein
MATFMNKRKVLSVAGEVTVIINNGKKEAHVSGIWCCKFYNQK